MSEITTNVNWVAVVVGAVLAYLLGWLWYSPKLFGSDRSGRWYALAGLGDWRYGGK